MFHNGPEIHFENPNTFVQPELALFFTVSLNISIVKNPSLNARLDPTLDRTLVEITWRMFGPCLEVTHYRVENKIDEHDAEVCAL